MVKKLVLIDTLSNLAMLSQKPDKNPSVVFQGYDFLKTHHEDA